MDELDRLRHHHDGYRHKTIAQAGEIEALIREFDATVVIV